MHNTSMAVQITIRNVSDEVRDKIAERAARKRQSMQAFLHNELERIALEPSREEVMQRIRDRVAASNTNIGSEAIVKMIREDRGR